MDVGGVCGCSRRSLLVQEMFVGVGGVCGCTVVGDVCGYRRGLWCKRCLRV